MIISQDILRRETVDVLKAVNAQLEVSPLEPETQAVLLCAKIQAINTLVLLQQR